MGGDPIFAQGQNRQLATGDLKALPSLRRAASNIPGFCTQVCRKFSNRPLASSAAKMAAFHVAVRPEAVPYPWEVPVLSTVAKPNLLPTLCHQWCHNLPAVAVCGDLANSLRSA